MRERSKDRLAKSVEGVKLIAIELKGPAMRVVILCLLLALGSPAFAQDVPAITVSGTGEVAVAPDMVTISIGVTHEAKTARAAMDAFNTDVAAVLARLDVAGVAPADMQTSGLSLRPVQNYNSGNGSPRITGYIASTTVTTVVRDLNDLPGLLDQLVSTGATDLGGLRFGVADRAPHLAEARRAAVADAREKAETFAGAAGLTLGPVLAIHDAGAAMPQPQMEMRSMAADSGVPIAAGEITISANVTMRYVLE